MHNLPMRVAGAVAVAVTLVIGTTAADSASTTAGRGSLGQLAGVNGCTSQTDPREAEPMKGCSRGIGLLGASAVALSPDGRGVYVSAGSSNAVAAFTRSPATGTIAEQNCTSGNGTSGVDGTKGACADGDALAGASGIAASPDGQFVYATSYDAGGVAIFSKGAGGSLKQVGCVRAVRTCVNAFPLAGAYAIALSPDGANAYVVAATPASNAVVTFSRNARTGMLAPLGCISDDGHDGLCTTGNALRGADAVVVSADGKQVYVGTAVSNSVLTFERDPDTGLLTQHGCVMHEAPRSGSCVAGKGLDGVGALTLAPDGKTLYVAAYNSSAISVLARDPQSGALRWIGCESEVYDESEKDGCGHGRPLAEPVDIAVSKDNSTLYLATASGLTTLSRNPATGALAVSGCLVSEADADEDNKSTCQIATGVGYPSGVALSPDQRNLYVTSSYTNSIAVLAPGPAISQVSLSSRGVLRARVTCPDEHSGRCAGALGLRADGQSTRGVDAARFDVRPGASRTVRVRLGAATRARLARPDRLTAIVSASDASHTLAPIRRMIVLRSRHERSTHPRGRPH
jgi:DNA-binding beta-propeller fold protein YncE